MQIIAYVKCSPKAVEHCPVDFLKFSFFGPTGFKVTVSYRAFLLYCISQENVRNDSEHHTSRCNENKCQGLVVKFLSFFISTAETFFSTHFTLNHKHK
jgi:hypothetical protein